MSSSARSLEFDRDVAPLVWSVAVVTLFATLSVLTHWSLFGRDPTAYPEPASTLVSVPFMLGVVASVWWLLRRDGGSLRAVGFGRSALLPAVVAFAVLWIGVSLSGLGYLLATGRSDAISVALPFSWPASVAWFLLTLTVANGIPEELAFRGYVQNKVAALAAARGWGPADPLAIVVAAVLFGVPHGPLAILLFDLGPGAVPAVLLSNLVPGITYGLVYYLTGNLWYASFVHGFGNAPLIPFELAAVPYFVPFAAVMGLVVALCYRYWGLRTDRVAVRIETGIAS